MKKQPVLLTYLCCYALFSFWHNQAIPFLTASGYTATERGIMISCYGVASILFQLTLGYLSDRYQRVRPFLLLVLAGFALSAATLFLTSFRLFALHLLLMILSGGLVSANINMVDNWFFSLGDEVRPWYGVGRACASFGWLLGSLSVAHVIGTFGFKGFSASFPVLAALSGLLILSVRSPDQEQPLKAAAHAFRLDDIRTLYSNRRYALLVLGLFFINCATCTAGTVVIDKMLILGANSSQIGLRWALGAIIEVPVFLFGGRLLCRFKPEAMLAVSAVFVCAQYYLCAAAPNVSFLILTCLFQVLTVPLNMLGSKTLLYDLSPQGLKSSGLLFACAAYQGLSMLIIPVAGGIITDHFGVNVTLYTVTGLAVVGLLVILGILRMQGKPQHPALPPAA